MWARVLFCAAALAAVLAATSCEVSIRATTMSTERPPEPLPEVVPTPRAGLIWVPGRWQLVDLEWRWTPGRYLRDRGPAYRFKPGHWVEIKGRHYWIEDRWEHVDEDEAARAAAP